MRQTVKNKYESLETHRVTVILEGGGICAASKDEVVTEDNNTSVDITEQDKGGDYEIGSWD